MGGGGLWSPCLENWGWSCFDIFQMGFLHQIKHTSYITAEILDISKQEKDFSETKIENQITPHGRRRKQKTKIFSLLKEKNNHDPNMICGATMFVWNDKKEAGAPIPCNICWSVATRVRRKASNVVCRGYTGNYATKHLSFYDQVGLQMRMILMT